MAEEVKKTEEKAEESVEKAETLEAAEKLAKEGEETVAKAKKKKKIKRQIQRGQAHIQCSYNNTLITISDLNGEILAWSSAGLLGFKGAKKSTPFASTQVAGDVTEKVKKYGMNELEVYVKGVGSGREAAIRSLANRGFELVSIKDITPIPHNGCRPRKPRRV
jgi:small subunit ribosomal protein S11